MDPAQVFEAAELAKYHVINDTIARGDSHVQRFYAGAVVFVTGGSGFLGKQLIEKLFRSCDIKKMYLLMRPKTNKSCQTRLNDIFQDPLYEYLHNKKPNFVNNIVPVQGDVSEIRLGITDDIWTTLTEEVNIIFHVAANINILERLKKATLTNVRGTREMLHLAKECKNLRSLVHVSTVTAHTTCQRVGQQLLEQFYECPMSPSALIQLAEQYDDIKLDAMTPTIIENWPNTYSFTKAVTEELVRTTSGDLPVCIVRPAAVMAAYREPPGWLDKGSINGPIGMLYSIVMGTTHVLYAKSDAELHLVPVDLVNNAIIAAAHETVGRRERGETDIQIYTVSGTKTPIRPDDLKQYLGTKEVCTLTATGKLWHAYFVTTDNKFLFTILTWVLHFIPGYLADGVLMVLGKRPMAIKLLNKAYVYNLLFAHYIKIHWAFDKSNVLKLHENLSPTDRIIYHCDMSTVESFHYFMVMSMGIRKYIWKDGLQGTEYGIKKQKWLRVANAIFMTLYVYVLWKIINLLIYIVCWLCNLY